MDFFVSIFKSTKNAKAKYDNNRYLTEWTNDSEKKKYKIMCGHVEARREERIKKISKELNIDKRELTLDKLSQEQIEKYEYFGFARNHPPDARPVFKKKRRRSSKKNEDRMELDNNEEENDETNINAEENDINVQTEKKSNDNNNREIQDDQKYNTENKYDNENTAETGADPDIQIISVKMERKEIDLRDNTQSQQQIQPEIQQPQPDIQPQADIQPQPDIHSPTATDQYGSQGSPTQQYSGSDYEEEETYDWTVNGLEEDLQLRINQLGDKNIQFYVVTTLNGKERNFEYDKLFIDMIEKVSKAYISIGYGIHGSGVPHFPTGKALNIIRCFVRLKDKNVDILEWMDLWMEIFESHSSCLSAPTFCANNNSEEESFLRFIMVKKALFTRSINSQIIDKKQEIQEYIQKRKETNEQNASREETMVSAEIRLLEKKLIPYNTIIGYFEKTIRSSLPYIWESQYFGNRYGMALFMVCGYTTVAGSICSSFLINTCLNAWAAGSDGVWEKIVMYFNDGLKFIKNIIYGELALMRKICEHENKPNGTVCAAESYIKSVYNIWNRLSKINNVRDSSTLDLIIETLDHIKPPVDCEQIGQNIQNILSNKRKVSEISKIYLETFNKEWLTLKFFDTTKSMEDTMKLFKKIKYFKIYDIAVPKQDLVDIISNPLKFAPQAGVSDIANYAAQEYMDLTEEMADESYKCMYFFFLMYIFSFLIHIFSFLLTL